jgi:hypothetical protein
MKQANLIIIRRLRAKNTVEQLAVDDVSENNGG